METTLMGLCWPRLCVYYWEDHFQPQGGHSVDLTCFLSFPLFSWSFKTFKLDTSDPFILKTRCAQLERGKGATEFKLFIVKRAELTSRPGFVFSAPSLTSASFLFPNWLFSLPSKKRTMFSQISRA